MDELTYRDIRPDDFDAVHDYASQWTVVRQLGSWPWPPKPEFTRSRCQPYAGEGFVWAVCIGTELAGTIGATSGQIGYTFAPRFHRQGIGSRAAKYAVTKAFETYDWDFLYASAWYDNPGSDAVLRKCGFRHWQTHFEASIARGVPTLLRQYRLTRSDWHRLRSTAQ